jgi:hypothetical protein
MDAEQLRVRIEEIEEWLSEHQAATLRLRAAKAKVEKTYKNIGKMYTQEQSLAYKLANPPRPKPQPPKKKACPTPSKRAFPNSGYAIRAVLSASRGYGKPMRYYRCVCGQWHMTKKVG